MKAIRHVLAFLGIGFIAEQVARTAHFLYGVETGEAARLGLALFLLGLVSYAIGHEVFGD